jgi:hypothetical protein
MSSDHQPVPVMRIEGSVMAVNSYVVEGPGGLVIVDGQLTVSDAGAVRRAADRLMGDEWPSRRRFVDEIVEPSAAVGLAGLDPAAPTNWPLWRRVLFRIGIGFC